MRTFKDICRRSKYLIHEVTDKTVREFFCADPEWPIGGNDTIRCYVFIRCGDVWYGDYDAINEKWPPKKDAT